MLSSRAFVSPPAIDHVSDAELLERVSKRTENAFAARAAETEFYDQTWKPDDVVKVK